MLKKNVTVEDLTDLSLMFIFEKPDKTSGIINAVLDEDDDTKFRVDFSNQVFAVPGVVKAELRLLGPDEEAISTKQFKIMVDDSIADGSIVSENERGILDRAFELAEDLIPRIELLDVELLEDVQSRQQSLETEVGANASAISGIQDDLSSHLNDYTTQFADLKEDLVDITDFEEIYITDTLQKKSAYIPGETIAYWNASAWGVAYFACSANTTYSITKTAGNKFICCWIDTDPAVGVTVNNKIDFGSNTSAEYSTGANAKYVLIQATNNSAEMDTILSSMTVSYTQVKGAKDAVARGEVAILDNKFNLLTDSETFYDESTIKIDAEWTEGQYVDPNNGSKPSAESLAYSQKIDVEEGNIITFQNSNGTDAPFRFIAAYLNDVLVPIAGKTTEAYSYTVPSGVNSIIASAYIGRNITKISVTEIENKTKISVKPNRLGFTTTSGNLSNGESLTLPYHNVKNNNVLVFSANITSFSSIKIGKQSNAYITIDDTDVVVTANGTTLRTYQHGLTFGSNIQILLENETATKLSLIRIVTDGNEYSITDNTTFLLDEGSAYVTSIGSTLTDCVFSWSSRNINKPIWLFGDSYFSWYDSRWTYYLARDGFTESCMLNGYAGESSRTAYSALENLLKIRTPKMVVWCLGMNDPDGETEVSASWKEFYDKVVNLSKKYAFELVLYTTPTTPTMNNNYKNAIVRASGYRYVDADNAVRIDNDGHWITGALAVDNVHPTTQGAIVLYYRFLADLPELTSM